MGIRIGTQKYAIGYIHKFSFDMKRGVKPIWQIEPYMDVLGTETTPSGIKKEFGTISFDENTKYFPGEAIEVIPGKMEPLTLKLDRYALYTGNLMSAVLRATGGGVYDSVDTYPNVQ
jgi:hypothetical protein